MRFIVQCHMRVAILCNSEMHTKKSDDEENINQCADVSDFTERGET